MENYESPTIEQAGGVGNKVEPQQLFAFVFEVFVAVAAWYALIADILLLMVLCTLNLGN